MKNNPLATILLVILALVAADLFLNDGRALASIASGNSTATVLDTAVEGQNLNNFAVQQVVVTATPGPGGVTLTIIDDDSEPVIKNLVPTATATATAVPESIINYEDVIAQPTRDYDITDEQLAACIQAQQTGRRLAPYCPPNPAEYAGQGR